MTDPKPISEQQYPFAQIEAKWQKTWEERGTYKFDPNSPRPKYYVLSMFSYPSGDKLHMGHWYNFAPADSYARFKRMQGHNVFEPMGFDSFGLPAENYAIKTGIHPAISTEKNCAFMREQLKRIGAMYDWDYEVVTSDPAYYKWTQWWFLLMYKRGLAYQKEAFVNWCPNDQTVLANEQVEADNTCERCGTPVVRKKIKQWFYKISDYNQRLLDGLDTLDWPEKTKAMQRYWIGKSEGTEIEFKLQTANDKQQNVRVFTTRADTLFGVTYVVLAPEHPLVSVVTTPERKADVERYVESSQALSDVDRTIADRPKTGCFTGAFVIHPLTAEKLPLWVADYVIGSYGTGAVMAVPAHDQRDFEFAREFKLPVKQVIEGKSENSDPKPQAEAMTEYGMMINSEEFDGLSSYEGIRRVGEKLNSLGLGEPKTTWHLRDWTISRQRYWGCPIPIVYCESCGVVPVPESQLPVVLPHDVAEYKPKGKAPLETVASFMVTTCPTCGGAARRDPDTMDTFVDSSWYFMRYAENRLDSAPFSKETMNKMLPVDQYIGGSEHAMGHLIYSRFFHKVAKDAGYVDCEEPFQRLTHQGMILNKGLRMSKSKGNVVAPEAILERYGSDVLRCFMMFMGDYTLGGEWSDQGITGVERFIARVWRLGMSVSAAEARGLNLLPSKSCNEVEIPAEINRKLHQTIKAVSEDLQALQFNTGIARLMELTNAVYNWVGSDLKHIERTPAVDSVLSRLITLMAPFAPHLSEELWHELGFVKGSTAATVFDTYWPVFDEEIAKDDQVTVAIQINGKLRETMTVGRDMPEAAAIAAALALEKLKPYVEGKQIVKTIVVPNKIVNIVVR